MKRFWGVMVVVSIVTSVFAQDSLRENNFRIAGAILKAEAESTLTVKAGYASQYFLDMVPNRGIQISKSQFVELEKHVDIFLDTKANYDARLSLYGLKTETKIDSDLVVIVRTYFVYNFPAYRDDDRETIRGTIARKTGHDVTINRGLERHVNATIVYVILSGLCIWCFYGIGKRTGSFVFLGWLYVVAFWIIYFVS